MTTVRVRASRRQATKRAAPARRGATRHVDGARRLAKRRPGFAPARSRGGDARLAGARRPVAAATPGSAPVARPRRWLAAGFRVMGFLGAFTLTLGGLSTGGVDRTAPDDLPAPLPTMTAEAAPAVSVETPAAAAPERTFASPPGLRAEMRSTLEQAADTVGIDVRYLVAVAARESRFDPKVRAQGTTAAGLYQFTEDTWLRAVRYLGARHGLGEYARQIASNARGDLSMPEGRARATLMKLRHDPALAALMAAELARDNKVRLERLLAREVTPAETYVAHLLGVTSAARLIIAAAKAPRMAAADLLPTAARSNPGVFTASGHALSASAMVAKVEADFERRVPHAVT